MNLFLRSNVAKIEHAAAATAFAVEVASYVSNASGVDVHAWAIQFGRPLGTMSWSMRVDSGAAMADIGDKLLADTKYTELLATSFDMFTGPIEDVMAEVLAAAGPGGDVGHYTTFVTAQCAGGHMADAMTWGVDAMNHVAGLTGLNHTFVRSLYGPFASVGWITSADTAAEIDAANAAMAADASYLSMLDKAGDYFVPGSANTVLSRRLT